MRTKRTSSRMAKRAPIEHKHVKSKSCISEAAPCINPAFMDEKYIASRKIEDYHYSIYVKSAKPEIRDAMMFLNLAFHRRELLYYDVQGKAEARVYMSNATQKLLDFADENIGALKLFFTKTNNIFPLTGAVMDPHMWREEFSLELLMSLIDSADDEQLYVLLLTTLNTKGKVNKDFVKRIISNRDILVLYLEGAAYEHSVRADLLELYDATSLQVKSNPSLRTLLKDFILDFYDKYKEAYEYAKKTIEKEQADIVKKIIKFGELPGVTDNYVFRRLIMRSDAEKCICIEFLPFCKTNIEYFASFTGITICVGNGMLAKPGSLSDSERVGEKLKLLNNEQLYSIMKNIFAKPASLAKVAAEVGVSPERTYKILSKLVEERYVYKDEKKQIYVANKGLFLNVIHLFERYGGE